MQPNNLKDSLLAGFRRFQSEGSSAWSREDLRKEICPAGYKNNLDDPEIQRVLCELEKAGHIKLYFNSDRYLEVLPNNTPTKEDTL